MYREKQLGTMTVADIRPLLKPPHVVTQNTPLDEILHQFDEDLATRHIYVVDDDGRLTGSIRLNNIISYLFPLTAVIVNSSNLYRSQQTSPVATDAASIMRRPPYFVQERTKLSQVARTMMAKQINELPVVDPDMQIIGQVNVQEIVHAYLQLTTATEHAG